MLDMTLPQNPFQTAKLFKQQTKPFYYSFIYLFSITYQLFLYKFICINYIVYLHTYTSSHDLHCLVISIARKIYALLSGREQ